MTTTSLNDIYECIIDRYLLAWEDSPKDMMTAYENYYNPDYENEFIDFEDND